MWGSTPFESSVVVVPVEPVVPRLPSPVAETVRRPVMTQFWADVVFLHWRYDPGEVQRLLPAGVTVDTYDGSAWVALVPFRMERLGLPGLGPLPWVNTFPEVNVRTYVHSGDRRGVWFFSLDIDLRLPTMVARTVYGLPYCYGTAHHERVGPIVTTGVRRRWPRGHRGAGAEVVVATGDPVDPTDELVHFLTDRWGLIATTRRGSLRYAAVDHPTWPLYSARVLHLDETLVEAAGLSRPMAEPHVMWSPGVDVRVALPTRRGVAHQLNGPRPRVSSAGCR